MNNLSIFDLSVFIVFAAILILASVCIFAVIMLNIQKELKYINLDKNIPFVCCKRTMRISSYRFILTCGCTTI